LMYYTNRACDVMPYSDDYDAKTDVPIVTACTAYQHPETGQVYILILNEALWFGDKDGMDHTLLNPNQMRNYQIDVFDNAWDRTNPLIIDTQADLQIPMKTKGTVIYFTTWAPTRSEIDEYPHIQLSSATEWNPSTFRFPGSTEDEEEDDSVPATVARFMSDLRITAQLDMKVEKQDIPEQRVFISSDRHSTIKADRLSEMWGISKKAAEKTLKVTTQRGIRSAMMPLSRRYKSDLIYNTPRLKGRWYTDTMMSNIKSIDGNTCAQIFANDMHFVEVYPMLSKSMAGDALRQMGRDYGIMENLTMDGSKEQTAKGSTFMKTIKKNDIKYHITEPLRHNQNRAETVIRELRRKWFRTMIRRRVPRRLWDYGLKWCAQVMSRTSNSVFSLNGRVPIEHVTGQTVDISEYLDMSFYDWVHFIEGDRLEAAQIGRWLGVASHIGGSMTYYVLKSNGQVIARSSVSKVTNLEQQTTEVKESMARFTTTAEERLRDANFVIELGAKIQPEDWSLTSLEEDPDWIAEFSAVVSDETVPEEEGQYDIGTDTYVNMEITLPRNIDGSQMLGRVTKRAKNDEGAPIGTANSNPLLDSRAYEIELADGNIEILRANVIAENLFAQVDDDGQRFQLLDEISDHRKEDDAYLGDDAFVEDKKGRKHLRKSYRGWSLLVSWKDGSTNWVKLKDLVNSNPIETAEYAVNNKINLEPAFSWWTPSVLRKRDRIVSKVKAKYWARTHKYGILIPKNMEDAKRIDERNGDTIWQDAVREEMTKINPALVTIEGNVDDYVGYQRITGHLIFDIKPSEGFRRKARYVAGGHKTSSPTSITYSSVVSRDSVRIVLLVAALNGLEMSSCDIKNAYLTADCREKILIKAGTEFGERQGQWLMVRKALYGLKSSGAAFRSFLAEHIHDLGFMPSRADPDCWMRPATKPNGFEYYEYMLVYVDDILVASHDPTPVMEGIKKRFELKGNKYAEPTDFLGAQLKKRVIVDPESGLSFECWSMSSTVYVNGALKNIEERLKKGDLPIQKLQKGLTPLSDKYRPEVDVSEELNAEMTTYYQELIGILRWSVEIGRADILLEVSMMSSQLANPRIGHLTEVLHIFSYLKRVPKKTLYFNPAYHIGDERRFVQCNWMDFYGKVTEAIPGDMPVPRGNIVDTTCFVDASHASCLKTRRSQTGILLFVNKAPITWYSKRQNTVETSTFSSEFIAMKVAVEMIEALRYKLRWFGIPLDGPTSIYCDNEAVCNSARLPESTLKKKHNSIAFHRVREFIASGAGRVAWEGTDSNLSDLFTKTLGRVKREDLIDRWMY
jgi:hypothetical protein